MKKIRLACAALALALPLFSATAAELQKPEPGFGGLAWGDAPTKDMVLLDGTKDGEAIYRKNVEASDVGGVPAEAVRYVFWKNRLLMVGLHGTRGFSALLSSLAENWGPGFQADMKQQRFTWTSAGATGRTIAGLDMENATGYYLAIFSEDLTDAMEVERVMGEKQASR
jgi:hypothetical protein